MGERHPDLFTAAEAIEYLHLDPETGEATLEYWRAQKAADGLPLLRGKKIGKALIYHRDDLNALVRHIFGL